MNSVRFVDDRMNTIVFVLFTQTASAACLPVRASNDSLNENKKMKTNANSVCIEFTCTAAVSAAAYQSKTGDTACSRLFLVAFPMSRTVRYSSVRQSS